MNHYRLLNVHFGKCCVPEHVQKRDEENPQMVHTSLPLSPSLVVAYLSTENVKAPVIPF